MFKQTLPLHFHGALLTHAVYERDFAVLFAVFVEFLGDLHVETTVFGDLQEPALSFSMDAGASSLYGETGTRKGYVHVDCAWSVTERLDVPAGVLR